MQNFFTIKNRIGRGAQHKVGTIGDGLLIKYPHWTGRRWDVSTPDTVRRDLEIHRRWNTPIPETRVIAAPTIDDGQALIHPPYAIVVEEIVGRLMRETDLKNPDIQAQFAELMERSLGIRRQTNSGVDFMGFESIKHLCEYLLGRISADELGACNIMIHARERIKLIDTSLLTPARAPLGVSWAIDYLIDVQHGLMARVLQDQKLIRQSGEENHSRLMTALSQQIYQLSRAKNGTKHSPLHIVPAQFN